MDNFEVKLNGMPNRKELRNSKGILYAEYKKFFHIKVPTLLLDVTLPWLMIASMMILLSYLRNESYLTYLSPLIGLWICYWFHAYAVFIHEAAHYNLCPDKKLNDYISNIFLTPFVGLWVKHYRKSHWQHHLFLGTLKDTEISYQKAVSVKSLIGSLAGIYQIKIVLRYLKNFTQVDNKKKSSGMHFFSSLVVMLVTQITICVFLYLNISMAAALSWALCVFIFLPVVSSLRQTLEHRSYSATDAVDYSLIEHGPVNRIFGNDLFSRYFGGAGFNRHMLHHFDPSVSYTSFEELERFILDTNLAKWLEDSRTSYFSTFLLLLKK